MKLLKVVPHTRCNISLYQWNGKYIIKFEQPLLEQTFKVNELDVTGLDEVEQLISNARFINNVLQRFEEMRQELNQALMA